MYIFRFLCLSVLADLCTSCVILFWHYINARHPPRVLIYSGTLQLSLKLFPLLTSFLSAPLGLSVEVRAPRQHVMRARVPHKLGVVLSTSSSVHHFLTAG